MKGFVAVGFFLTTSVLYALDFGIKIDAERDEWYNTLTGPETGRIHIPHEANNDNGGYAKHDDEYDLSADFWCAWDETYFYFYEEVWDDYVSCSSGTPWENDCMELKFDPDPLIGLPKNGSGVYALRMTALDSTETDGPPSGVDNMYPEGNSLIAGFHYVPGEDYARRETSFGYIVEGRVPWEHICFPDDQRGPVQPAVGNLFGMAIMNHENEGEGFYGSIEWASEMQDAVWNTVTYHGSVTFLDDHRLKMSTENAITGIDTNRIDYRPRNVHIVQTLHPSRFELLQNYPNPFNSQTTIEFFLPAPSYVTLQVFDQRGAQEACLCKGCLAAGRHRIIFRSGDLSSGVYFYRLNADGFRLMKKMMILK